ncbi:MAG: FkbM family methyltransferase [Vicinamibacterales bacterium]
MKIPRPKLNAIEFAMWGALVAALAYMAGMYRTTLWLQPSLPEIAELQPLAQKYGPARNSRYGEEWILRDFFHDQRAGVFVDVGASHYQRDSNTYYLETALGWSGLAIEPQTTFAAEYAKHRPLTTFVPLFVSDASNRQAVLYVPPMNQIASFDKSFAESAPNSVAQPVSVNTATLDDILARNGIEQIDFLSIDIELHEPQALSGFSIDRFQPRLVAVEAHAAVRQQILDYFAKHGYVALGKYLRADTENLWFAPMGEGSRPAVARR